MLKLCYVEDGFMEHACASLALHAPLHVSFRQVVACKHEAFVLKLAPFAKPWTSTLSKTYCQCYIRLVNLVNRYFRSEEGFTTSCTCHTWVPSMSG